MGMPGWAQVLAAPYAIDKTVVDPLTSAYGLYRGIRNSMADQQDKAAGIELLKNLQTDPNAPIDLSKFTDPKAAEETYNRAAKYKTELQTQQALPVLQNFARGYKTAVGAGDFTDPESMDVLKAEGVQVPTAQEMANPYVAKGVSDLGKSSQNEADIGDIAKSLETGTAPPSSALGRFLTLGGEKSTNQVKTLADLAKQNEELRKTQGIQQWINGGGNSPDVVAEPRLRTVMASAPRGVTLEDLSKMTQITGVVPEWKNVETGTGNGLERQQVMFNPRTGSTGDRIGETWKPPETKITNTLSYQGDKKGIESLVGKLPEYKEGADSATDSNARIDKMMGLLNKGAGGAQGYAKATVAPMLEMFGVKSQGLTDAQLYQRLAATLAGSLRTQVVGPGPVSNYEQQLLKKVSGGGAIGEDAAKELLQFYKDTNVRKIATYDNTIDAIGAVAPETSKLYKRMGSGKGAGKKDKGGKSDPLGIR